MQGSAPREIAIEVELYFGEYFYTIKCDGDTLGTYSKYGEDCIRATSTYSNKHTFHRTNAEARSAIISACTKQPVILPEIPKARYLVKLESEELIASITCELHKEIELDEDALIDWNLWVKRYNEELGENFRLISFDHQGLNAEPERNAPVLTPLSEQRKCYAVSCQDRRLGLIKPIDELFLAIAEDQYGARENSFKTLNLAKNWLFLNSRKIAKAEIEFQVTQDRYHYTIESGFDWLIKIDKRERDCLASINYQNDLRFEYFPNPRAAIAYSFDLILSSKPNNYRYRQG